MSQNPNLTKNSETMHVNSKSIELKAIASGPKNEMLLVHKNNAGIIMHKGKINNFGFNVVNEAKTSVTNLNSLPLCTFAKRVFNKLIRLFEVQ